MSKCDCKLCNYSRFVESVIELRDVDKLVALVKDMHNASYDMGHDNEYMSAVLDGSWPSSVEQLERALEKARKVKVEENAP